MGKVVAQISAFFRSLFGSGRSRGAAEATNAARAALRSQFIAAAGAHRVGINPEMMAYMVTGEGFVAHVPLAGIDRYQDADFAAGAPIQLVIVRGNTQSLPDGSYVVKAQYRAGAGSGTAIFLDRTGAEAARRDLTVLTWRQATEQFPGLYPHEEPQNLPVVTSSHQLYDPKVKYWRTIVDCAGWKPYRVVWYGFFRVTPGKGPGEAETGAAEAGGVLVGRR